MSEENQEQAVQLPAEMVAGERLMKAAQKFALTFQRDRSFTDETHRLTYMLTTWRELGLAALAFAKEAKS